jgi:hypothetical protein
MTKIVGLEDIKSGGHLQQELQQGGKFVMYQYCIRSHYCLSVHQISISLAIPIMPLWTSFFAVARAWLVGTQGPIYVESIWSFPLSVVASIIPSSQMQDNTMKINLLPSITFPCRLLHRSRPPGRETDASVLYFA